MAWIEKIFKKKEESVPGLRFDDLPQWLESRSQKISIELGRHAESLFSEIKDACSRIEKSVSVLEHAEPEGRFHLKMVKIATSNRDNMIKQVRMLLENVAIPKTRDIRTVVAFHENAMQSLTVCLENMMKSYQYTKMVFLEDSKRVIADVNALGRLLNQLIEPINERKNMISAYENSGNAIAGIKKFLFDIGIENLKIKENVEKMVLLNKDLEEKQIALTRIKEGEIWKQYRSCNDELLQLEDSAKKAESEINALILPLNKALGRLRQLDESGRIVLKPHTRDELNLCLSDPKSVSPEFFIDFHDIIKGNALELSSEKQDKIIEQTERMAVSLERLKKQYQDLVLKIEQKKNDISRMKIDQEVTGLTKEIGALQEKMAFTEKELEISKKRLSSLNKSIELKKQELAQNIAIIDSSVRISF